MGELIGMLSVHVDDLGITGEEMIILSAKHFLEKHFGEMKQQKGQFKHVGHRYTVSYHSVVTGQDEYVKGTEPPFPLKKHSSEKLTPAEMTELRRVNGEMAYASQGRLDYLGRIALCCQGAHGESTVEDLTRTRKVLKELQEDPGVGTVRYDTLRT